MLVTGIEEEEEEWIEVLEGIWRVSLLKEIEAVEEVAEEEVLVEEEIEAVEEEVLAEEEVIAVEEVVVEEEVIAVEEVKTLSWLITGTRSGEQSPEQSPFSIALMIILFLFSIVFKKPITIEEIDTNSFIDNTTTLGYFSLSSLEFHGSIPIQYWISDNTNEYLFLIFPL